MKALFRLHFYSLKHRLKALFLALLLLTALTQVFKLTFIDNSNMTAVPIAIVDGDLSPTSIRVIEKMMTQNVLQVTQTDLKTANKLLVNHQVEAIVWIKAEFEMRLQMGDYEKCIDLIYLDRSIAAPALTDTLAAAVLQEASVYNAALLVKRYDPSPEAIKEVTDKVRTAISAGIYRVPIEAEMGLVRKDEETLRPLQMQSLLPKRLSLGYTLLTALLIATLFSGELAKDLLGSTGKRIRTTGTTATVQLITAHISYVLVLIGLSLGMILFILGPSFFGEFFILLPFIAGIGMGFSSWLSGLFILAFVMGGSPTYFTAALPAVTFLGLISGCFWPLDFLSHQVRIYFSVLPSFQLMQILESALVGQFTGGFNLLSIGTWLMLSSISLLLQARISST